VPDLSIQGAILPTQAPAPGSGPYLLGVHYFPGWTPASAWSSVPAGRLPIIGAYDETLQSVCNGQLAQMATFGIDFVNLVWFWNVGTAQPHAGHWATSYMASPTSPKPKFCLMWDNTFSTHTPASWETMTTYWAANYAGRADMLRVNGKPVVIVYVPDTMKSQVAGNTDAGMAAALNAARAKGNFYFIASTSGGALLGSGAGSALAMGFDAVTTYNLISGTDWNSFMPAWSTWYRQAMTACPLPVLLPMTSGWDSSPVSGPAISNPTIDQFEGGLREAKAYADFNPAKVLGLCMNAWNEYLEGSYIEPATNNGGTARGLKMKAIFGK
jgi:Glycosyltransferase WbsX